jgi:hypothetical protein
VARKKCKSYLLTGLLNRIGASGYFTRFIEKLGVQDGVSIETMCYTVEWMSKCAWIFNKGFLNEYLPILFKAIQAKLLASGDAAFRNIRKDRLDSLISAIINGLLPRIMAYRQRDQEKNLFTLEIACHLLSLNFLERRIDGAKFI